MVSLVPLSARSVGSVLFMAFRWASLLLYSTVFASALVSFVRGDPFPLQFVRIDESNSLFSFVLEIMLSWLQAAVPCIKSYAIKS